MLTDLPPQVLPIHGPSERGLNASNQVVPVGVARTGVLRFNPIFNVLGAEVRHEQIGQLLSRQIIVELVDVLLVESVSAGSSIAFAPVEKRQQYRSHR